MEQDKKKNEHAVAMGKLGGPARAKSLTKERRVEIARNAGQNRWKHKDVKEEKVIPSFDSK